MINAKHAAAEPALTPEERAAQWRHTLAEQREANARWDTFLAAYGPNSPKFNEQNEVHAEEVLNANVQLLQLPAPDIAALADKIEVAWIYSDIVNEVRATILADARRLADEITSPWR